VHVPTLNALEFTRIQQEMAGFAACQLGKELALATLPLPSLTLIRSAQQETTEALAILAASRAIPFGGIQDIRLFVERAAAGGALRPEQLTAVADTVYGCRQLHSFLIRHEGAAPLLSRHAAAFGQFDEVETEIRRCIDRGSVSSRASRALKEVRSEIAVLEGRVQERLNAILKQVRQHLQDALVTTRNGRYVVPVRSSDRGKVPGTVHGSSASGSTLFVEPEAIRQLSDELETWRAMEEAEIFQVLAGLSGLVAAHTDGLQATLGVVAELDLVFARARLSQAWEARPVTWNEEGVIDLRDARHPLLGKAAAGNHIRLTPSGRMLIVTGPNTGGKTLLLKTLGLLVLIAQCGMHIPVGEGSTLCPFEAVLADIGDHQSLAQSLSTFSGHIAAIAPMLAQAGPRTLILLDELGSGTDPHEGTGLGIALLEAFLGRGAYTLATTHLREIKEFGRVSAGCRIAGMGFDGETLRPTYQLIYGTLGESHGLEIAARAGLPGAVVERARALVYGPGTALPPTPPMPDAPPPAAEPSPAVELPRPVQPAALTQRGPLNDGLALVLAGSGPSRCRVWQDGAERDLRVADVLRRKLPGGLLPGDRVRVRDGQAMEAAIRRNTLVSRDADTMMETAVAANLSQILILLSARQPDFHATALTRHLLYAERQGVPPIICLTKGELVPAEVAEGWLEPFRALGYPTLVVSAIKRRGLEEVTRRLEGQFTAVIGLPGAGKSTLLEALGVRRPTGAGRLPAAAQLPGGAWLTEMPGLRELGVWKPDLSGGFGEQYHQLLRLMRLA
jgi:putative ribosome biogenesis GTPase RsgA